MTIGAAFDQTVARFAEGEALVVRHQQLRYSWGELGEAVDRCARALLAIGMQPGERLGIWAPNCAQWCIAQFASAKVGVVPTVGKDTFQFSLTAGNALGRYMGQAVFADGSVDTAGELSLNNQWGAILAYRHFWMDNLRSTLALSTARASNPSGVTTANMNESADTAHLNLLWSPVASTTFGLELIHARRETEDGRNGDLNRVQTSAQYNF